MLREETKVSNTLEGISKKKENAYELTNVLENVHAFFDDVRRARREKKHFNMKLINFRAYDFRRCTNKHFVNEIVN